MGQSHTLGGVGDQISRHQGILHSHMAHGDTVADRDGRKYHRDAPRLGNTHLYGVDNLIQVHMSRHDLIVGTHDSHHGFLHLFLGKSKGVKQAAVRRLLHAAFYIVTSHLSLLLFSFFLFPAPHGNIPCRAMFLFHIVSLDRCIF